MPLLDLIKMQKSDIIYLKRKTYSSYKVLQLCSIQHR